MKNFISMNPANLFLHLAGLISVLYGLWIQSFKVIIWIVVMILIVDLIQYFLSIRKSKKKGGRLNLSLKVRKKGALELSISTMVIIVLAVTMLIFGMVFIKKIMCAGIIITDQIGEGIEDEIKRLIELEDFGVKCIGEEGKEIRLGDGGRRQIFCVIKSKSNSEYSLKFKKIESISGVKDVQGWVVDKDWSGKVQPGLKTVTVAVLDVPYKVSDTSLKIEVEEENKDTGNKETHTLYINIEHVGTLTSAIC